MKNDRYFAFISYKRGDVDEEVANWIHSKLEKYPYPVELVKPENRPDHSSLLRNIFIDTKDLDVTSDHFSDAIKEKLANSRYLLVICSERSAESSYVNDEIEYFLETHGRDYNKILPIFIDKIEDSLPKALADSGILSRNCPIFNTFLSKTNEINLYCFYHVVSFLIKVDFRDIYNRYKNYAARKYKHRKWLKQGIYTLLVLVIAAMTYSVVTKNRLISKQEEIVRLEKEIFPYSVVTGYTNNFLLPVINYFKQHEPEAHMFVHMPIRVKDITDKHKYRFDMGTAFIEKQFALDSVAQIRLKTRMPRGSIVHRMYSSQNSNLNHNYIDFATTTSTFLEIAKLKKNSSAYADYDLDDMVEEYTEIFIRQAKEKLQGDTVWVTFVKEFEEIRNYIK